MAGGRMERNHGRRSLEGGGRRQQEQQEQRERREAELKRKQKQEDLLGSRSGRDRLRLGLGQNFPEEVAELQAHGKRVEDKLDQKKQSPKPGNKGKPGPTSRNEQGRGKGNPPRQEKPVATEKPEPKPKQKPKSVVTPSQPDKAPEKQKEEDVTVKPKTKEEIAAESFKPQKGKTPDPSEPTNMPTVMTTKEREAKQKEYLDSAGKLIGNAEGFRPKAYNDNGRQAIGYGSRTGKDGKPVKKGDTVTYDEAIKMRERDIESHVAPMKKEIGTAAWDKLNPKQQAVVASLAYNFGPNRFKTHKGMKRMIHQIRTKDYKGAAETIRHLSDNRSGSIGKTLGLRRLSESLIFSGKKEVGSEIYTYS